MFNPQSIVYHVHAGTSKEWSPLFTFYALRNKILMCLKNAPFSFFFVSVVSYGRQIIKEFNTAKRSIHFEILYSLLKNFLRFCKKRYYVRISCKKIKDREVFLLFKRRKYREAKEVKTIGIYNAYFPTLGGGELLMGAMARSLLELFPGSFLEILCHPHIAFPDPSIFNHQLLEKWFSMCNFPYDLRKRVGLRVIKLPSLSPFHVQKIASKIWLSLASAKYDIFVNNTYRSNIIALGRLNIYNCMFPQRLNGMSYTPFPHLRAFLNYKFLTSYNIFLAISLFTRNHMESYWKISPFVLYPPIFFDNSSHFNSQKKENIILTVGRFFGGKGHVKKHDVIIDAFKRFCDGQQKHNWSLVLIGRRQHDTATQRYIKSLEDKARGYNVRFVFDAHTEILNEFLSKAKIYIHATGYGEDPVKNPDRFEHFGLAVLEAMSFGVIPIVFHGGGLSETVKHSFNGFLFKTEKELVHYLKYLIASSDKDIKKLRMRAKETAKRFSFINFKEKLELLLQNYF